MKAIDIKIGQLIKTRLGLATVMSFFAPAHIGCIIVSPYTKAKRFQQGCWIYLRGLDLEQVEIIAWE